MMQRCAAAALAAAVHQQQRVFVGRQPVGELVELAVGDVDRTGDVADVVAARRRPRVDDHDAFLGWNLRVFEHELGIGDVLVPALLGCGRRGLCHGDGRKRRSDESQPGGHGDQRGERSGNDEQAREWCDERRVMSRSPGVGQDGVGCGEPSRFKAP